MRHKCKMTKWQKDLFLVAILCQVQVRKSKKDVFVSVFVHSRYTETNFDFIECPKHKLFLKRFGANFAQ